MERRNFIKALMVSGVLGASPLASRAASELFASGTAQPVMIVSQSGLPQAAALVARLTQVLAAAGIEHMQAALPESEWVTFSHIATLLDRVSGGRVIGVMDDAAAVIFQELAAARGATCAVSTHHRFADRQVRHCCTSAGLDASLTWSDSLALHTQRMSRLYAGLISGQALAADQGAQSAGVGWIAPTVGAPDSLVSFLIHT